MESASSPRAAAVIVAAGRSTRLASPGESPRKPWIELDGVSVLEHVLAAFDEATSVVEAIVVAHDDDITTCEALCAERPAGAKVRAVVPGGAERGDSVRTGVFWCSFDVDLILVHDAARPLVSAGLIDEAARVAARDGAALAAVPVVDTVKVSADGCSVDSTLDRSVLWAAQTPQIFDATRFRECVRRAEADGLDSTDDAALWERYYGPVTIVEGDPTNLKITTPADVAVARTFLRHRRRGAQEPES